MRIPLIPILLLDGADRVKDNVGGLVPEFMNDAGFMGVMEAELLKTWFGPVCLYRGSRPA